MEQAILIVEDRALEGAAFLRAARMCAEATLLPSGEAAVAEVRGQPGRYFLALIDHDLGAGIDGCETARRIRELDPAVVLWVITGTELPHGASTAAARTRDVFFALKPLGLVDLRALVARAREAQPKARVERAVLTRADSAGFTPTETEVLRVAARGVLRADLARECLISRNTLKMHVRAMVEKWNGALATGEPAVTDIEQMVRAVLTDALHAGTGASGTRLRREAGERRGEERRGEERRGEEASMIRRRRRSQQDE